MDTLAGVLGWSAYALMLLPVLASAVAFGERNLRIIRISSFGRLSQLAGVACATGWLVLNTDLVRSVRDPLPRAWILVTAAAVGVLVVVRRQVGRSRRRPEGTPCRLVTLNVERDTPAAGAIAAQLRTLDADLVLVQEYTPATRDAAHAAGLPAAFPHGYEDAEEGWFGSALFSRWPLVGHERRTIGSRPMVVCHLDVDGLEVTVVNVHVQAPIHDHDIEPWRTAFGDLCDLAREADGPVVLAGDWNATVDHRPFRRMVRGTGLRDAHEWALRVFPRTWPTGRLLPPLLCLDHVVVNAGVGVHAIRELPFAGTDHRAVVADLAIS